MASYLTGVVKSRAEANSPHGRVECPRIYIPSHRSSLTQEHRRACAQSMHCAATPAMLFGGASKQRLRSASAHVRGARVARGGVRLGLFLFPFLALPGCFEGWCQFCCCCCFTRKSPAQPALVAVTKRTGSGPRGTQGIELAAWRSSTP